jgi:hypothetical protein
VSPKTPDNRPIWDLVHDASPRTLQSPTDGPTSTLSNIVFLPIKEDP